MFVTVVMRSADTPAAVDPLAVALYAPCPTLLTAATR
jgi:hypothetical protein